MLCVYHPTPGHFPKGEPMQCFHSRPESVPETLRTVPQWLAYRAVSVVKPDGSQKLNKIPVNPRTGRNGKSNDPSTWGTFAEACAFVRALPEGSMGGLGYAFTPGAGITAIDLDHCLGDEGELHPAAAELVAAFDSWTEMSPSGNGVHIWIKGTLEGVTSAKYAPGTAGFPFGVEIFCDRFFMTVTGIEPSPGKAVEDRQGTLRDLYRRLESA
jgi:primase-polymerase (primpol)-like protein